MKLMKLTLAALLLLACASLNFAADKKNSFKPAATLSAKQMQKLDKGVYEIPDSHEVLMTYIPAGEFVMGSPAGEAGRKADETQRTVKISQPFYMGVTEVTQAQYLNAMHPDHAEYCQRKGPWGHTLPTFYLGGPWHVNKDGGLNAGLACDRPMEMLTWDEAIAYAKWLTDREANAGRLPKGYVYRLPTEAEWEYACRAGTKGPLGMDLDLENLAGDSEPTSPFGRRKPNAWGLYDMHGMVYEWVHDWYAPYDAKETTDPKGPATGTERVTRSGCFSSVRLKDGERETTPAERLRDIRSAARNHLPQNYELPIVGMRLVLAPKLK